MIPFFFFSSNPSPITTDDIGCFSFSKANTWIPFPNYNVLLLKSRLTVPSSAPFSTIFLLRFPIVWLLLLLLLLFKLIFSRHSLTQQFPDIFHPFVYYAVTFIIMLLLFFFF